MSLRRLLAVIVKELRQLRRDRLTFAMIVGIPVMQLILFGYAINLDVRGLDAAVVDQAGTAHSREIIDAIGASQVLDLRYRVATPRAAEALLRTGRISAALVVPADLEARLARGDRPALQLMVDGADQVVQAAARQLVRFPVAGDAGWTRQVNPVEVVNFYNPERRAPINTVPGLIGVILTMTLVMFTAIALVRERENGNLELLFAVPIRGSTAALYAAALVFIVANLALGIFLSTLARSQFQAMQLAVFTFLPQILLSGFMFPFAGMPRAARWLAELLPLTHFLRLIRGIMLRGAGLAELWPSLAALGVFTLLMLGLTVSRLRKRLD